jgi:predicted ATPase
MMSVDRFAAPLGRPGLLVSIEAIVTERLRTLDLGSRTVLELAALLVREIDVRLIADALATTPQVVSVALERARASQFLVSAADRSEPLRFSHALIRGAIRAEISLERRPRLHARLAHALESRHDADSRSHELAHYWWEACRIEKSKFYDERTGDAALTVNAFADAVKHYRRALVACMPGDADRDRLDAKLEKCLAYEGEARIGS